MERKKRDKFNASESSHNFYLKRQKLFFLNLLMANACRYESTCNMDGNLMFQKCLTITFTCTKGSLTFCRTQIDFTKYVPIF